MIEEIWKDIEGYEGLYQVSNLGRVKSLERVVDNPKGGVRTLREKILKQHYDNNGYLTVTLYNNCKKKGFKVHRLVAEAFIPNPLNKPQVDHINTIRDCNNINNLRWVTGKENVNNTTSKENYRNYINNKKENDNNKIICITTGRIYKNKYQAVEEENLNYGHLIECLNGKRKTHKGCVWNYFIENITE